MDGFFGQAKPRDQKSYVGLVDRLFFSGFLCLCTFVVPPIGPFIWHLGFVIITVILLSNLYLKNSIFKTYFWQSVKGQVTAWDVQQYHVLDNLDSSIGFATWISSFILPSALWHFLCLINSCYRRHVACMHNRSNMYNICNTSNILTRLDKLNLVRLARSQH